MTEGGAMLEKKDVAEVRVQDGGRCLAQGDLVRGTRRSQHAFVVLDPVSVSEGVGERFSVKCFDLDELEVCWCDPALFQKIDPCKEEDDREFWEWLKDVWPRFEDGSPVKIGDTYATDDLGCEETLLQVHIGSECYSLYGETHDEEFAFGKPVRRRARKCSLCKHWQASPYDGEVGVCWSGAPKSGDCCDVVSADLSCGAFEERG